MKNIWQTIKNNLDQRTRRDRIFLLAVAVLVILVMWYYLFEKTLSTKITTVSTSVNTQQNAVANLSAQEKNLISEAKKPIDPVLVQQKNNLQQQLATIERTLVPLKNKVITVNTLPNLVKGMMGAGQRLSLNEFSVNLGRVEETAKGTNVAASVAGVKASSILGVTAPVEKTVKTAGGNISTPVDTKAPANASPPQGAPGAATIPSGVAPPPMAQLEPVTLKYRGSYFNTVRYLQLLKQLPWYFAVDNINYQVSAYPIGNVSLQLNVIKLEGGNNGG